METEEYIGIRLWVVRAICNLQLSVSASGAPQFSVMWNWCCISSSSVTFRYAGHTLTQKHCLSAGNASLNITGPYNTVSVATLLWYTFVTFVRLGGLIWRICLFYKGSTRDVSCHRSLFNKMYSWSSSRKIVYAWMLIALRSVGSYEEIDSINGIS